MYYNAINAKFKKKGVKYFFLMKGHFANVYKARYKNEDVAVKIYREITTAKQRKDFFLEGFMLGQNRHRNIIRFIGFATDRDPMMIVTEYVEGNRLNAVC